MIPAGRPFYKLSGSGNDFVFIDARTQPAGELETAKMVQAICARGTGVGADGIVFIAGSSDATLAIRYLNSDGSLAELCGNATLCAARLAVELGMAPREGDFSIETDSGVVSARFQDGLPEIDLQPISRLEACFEAAPAAGEKRIGFAMVGVPHLVVLCEDVDAALVVDRGGELRRHQSLAHGANVNFVSGGNGSWRVRTYERGVEAETLACGTGAVATGLLLAAWGAAPNQIELETRSGRRLRVRHESRGEYWLASLSGEARVVYLGQLAELPSTST